MPPDVTQLSAASEWPTTRPQGISGGPHRRTSAAAPCHTLVVTSRPELARSLSQSLSLDGHLVVCAASSEEILAARRGASFDAAIVDFADRSELMFDQAQALQGLPVLGLTRSITAALFRATAGLRGWNFLGIEADGSVDLHELQTTLRKLGTSDIFGVARYLEQGASSRAFQVKNSADRGRVVAAVEAFALQSQCHDQIALGLATALDEAISNALYSAPTNAHGRPLFAHLDRTLPVVLEDDRPIAIEVGCDGRRLAVATRDPFGSLEPQLVVDRLQRLLQTQRYEELATPGVESSGGAGLGLYMSMCRVRHFVINIAPGQATEVIGLVDVSKSFRRFQTRAKSFNLFFGPVP